MSNYLAIATVTAALQQLLQAEVGRDVSGVQVTTVRPDSSSSDVDGARINIFLYQATPNPAWRNADLRTRRPKGDLIKHGQAGLDLHYLLTFYGNESDLEPQRLMGSTIRVLVDQPLLTETMIVDSIGNHQLAVLSDSTLADQVQLVKFIPSAITTEDLSRIWSIFFQVPYSLSFAYQATAVLIQGETSGQVALPVSQRVATVTLARPVLKEMVHHPPGNLPHLANTITLASCIVLKGRDLAGSGRTQVQIGRARLTPHDLDEWEITLRLTDLPEAERATLRAGAQGIQVVRLAAVPGDPDRESAVESNSLPFVLCPQIQGELGLSDLEVNEGRYSGQVRIELDLGVDVRQRVYLLLNGTVDDAANTYIFRAQRRSAYGHSVEFVLQNVQPGEYLVRVQVDGAESPLQRNASHQYVGPRLVIA